MKKNKFKLGIVVALLSLLVFTNCEKENNVLNDTSSEVIADRITSSEMTNIVSSEEYNSLNDLEKEVVDMINSSINGLKGFSLNSKDKLSNHYATFNVNSSNSKNQFNNYILISSTNSKDYNKSDLSAKDKSCTACGIRTGIKCGRAIIAYISDNGLSDLDVHIHVNEDGCYEISW
jgi:hypothetical protein